MDDGEVKPLPWVDDWDDDVRRIVRKEQSGMEDRVTAAVIANVNQNINAKMNEQRDAISRVDAGQIYIIKRLDEQDGEATQIAATLGKLNSQIDRIEGRQMGIDQTESKYADKAKNDRERLISVAKIGAGVGGGGGVIGLLARWVVLHWHNWWR
jgi:hypothetical protein